MKRYQGMISRARLFVCLGAAWDLLLVVDASPNTQNRKKDRDALKETIGRTCASSFPAALMSFVDKWVEGALDVRAVCP